MTSPPRFALKRFLTSPILIHPSNTLCLSHRLLFPPAAHSRLPCWQPPNQSLPRFSPQRRPRKTFKPPRHLSQVLVVRYRIPEDKSKSLLMQSPRASSTLDHASPAAEGRCDATSKCPVPTAAGHTARASSRLPAESPDVPDRKIPMHLPNRMAASERPS